jgi:cell division protein FtsB
VKDNIKKNTKIIKRKKTKKKDAKVSKITFMILIFSSLSFVLLIIIFFLFNNFVNARSKYVSEIKNLNRHNNSLSDQISDLENKSVVAQKFIKKWKEELTDLQKSKDGISINKATQLLKDISKNHNINNLQINFSTPTTLEKNFKRKSIKVGNTLIDIKFDTISDINVLAFYDDIEKNIPNFIILESLEMVRTKKVNEEYFNNLRKGKVEPTLKASLKIRWYGISPINE